MAVLSIKQKWLLFFLFVASSCLAYFLQLQFLINNDASWLMHLARAILHGQKYAKNFFEINPPLSILIYLPEVFIEKIMPVSHKTGLRIYIFFLATLSFLICYFLSEKFFTQKQSHLFMYFLLMLITIFLILPLDTFGQREHILLILTTPYFLLAIDRVKNKSVHFLLGALVGILAGIGFSIQPYFFTAFILVEGYLVCCRKNIFAFLRMETTCIVLFVIFYVGLLLLFFKSYLSTVMPILLTLYYKNFSYDFIYVMLMPQVFFCIFVYILYFLRRKESENKSINDILMLSSVGYILAYFFQKTAWYYHILPACSMALLLLSILIFDVIKKFKIKKMIDSSSIAVIFIIMYFLSSFVSDIAEQAIADKKTLSSLVYFLQKNMRQQPVAILSIYTYPNSMLSETNAGFLLPYAELLWMRSYYNKKIFHSLSQAEKNQANYFTKMLSKCIMNNKPKLIFIDNTAYFKSNNEMYNDRVNIIAILTKNKGFLAAWKPYHYYKTINVKDGYEFDVYQRSLT